MKTTYPIGPSLTQPSIIDKGLSYLVAKFDSLCVPGAIVGAGVGLNQPEKETK